jgi:branched-chain amino acid transport system substrate-binding protein
MRYSNWAGFATAVALSVAATAAFGQADKISGKAVKIGVLTDMSGVYSDIGGQGSVTAAQMAIDDFKAKKKPAFDISVVYADHQNKPDIGAGKVREWIDQDGVDMITDALSSGVAIAVSKVVAEKKRILIDTGAGSSRLTNEDCTAYTIHHTYDTWALANGTGRMVVKQGGDSWFFITADYAFGKSLEDDTTAVIKANGGKVLGSVKHPLNASDFSSFLLQAQSSGAKVIGLANAGGDTINSIKAAAEFGLTKNATLAGLLVFISDVHSLGLQAAQNLYVTEAWYWDLNDESRAFGKRFFDKTKKMPTMNHAGVYSAVTMYLEAVQATGSDDADTTMAYMKKNKHSDMFGKNMVVREDGRMIHPMYLFQVKKPSESKSEWDAYTQLAKIPGNEAFATLTESGCAVTQ